MDLNHPRDNKVGKIKKVILAILPGLIVAGLVFSAATYYDLDLGKVIVEEITKIIGQLETTATTTLATISGQVGVGTEEPASLLEVYSNTTESRLTITAATSTDSILAFRTGATPTTQALIGIDQSDSNKLKLVRGSDIATSTGITIDPSNNVGVGTTTPSYKLEVSGMGSFDYIKYDKDVWVELANTPADVGNGASLIYTGGDYIYALGGGTAFWRYSISSDSWTSLANTPSSIGMGACLAYTGGDYIYAVRGQNTTDFWRYSISNDSWESMTNTPESVSKDDSSLVYTGGDYIYAFNSSGYWYRYSISSNSWTSLSSPPIAHTYGDHIVYGGGEYIYALKGGSNNNQFYRYTLGESWGYNQLANAGIFSRAPATIDASSSASLLNVTQSGTGYAAVFTGGNVGVGTTTPSAKLTVTQSGTGDIVNLYDASNKVFQVADGGEITAWRNAALTGGNLTVSPLSPPSNLSVATSSSAGSCATGTTYYYRVTAVNSNGETLGCTEASTSTGDATALDVSWSAVAGATGYKVYRHTSSISDGASVALVDNATKTATSFTDDCSGDGTASIPSSNTTGGNLAVNTNTLYVDAETGKVGIGTTTPASLLELYKADETKLTITSASSTDALIAFRTGSSPSTQALIGIDQSDSNKLKLVRGSDIATSTGITIDSSGNVGIGTTAPSYSLDVYGTVRGQNFITSGGYPVNDILLPQETWQGGPVALTGTLGVDILDWEEKVAPCIPSFPILPPTITARYPGSIFFTCMPSLRM